MALLTMAEQVVSILETFQKDSNIDRAAHEVMSLMQTVYDVAFAHGREGGESPFAPSNPPAS
jgi:hypothetical protein